MVGEKIIINFTAKKKERERDKNSGSNGILNLRVE